MRQLTTLEKTLTVALVAVLISAAVLLTVSWRIKAAGKIKALGCQVYSDPTLTTPLTLIDWGTMSPGDTKAVTMYVVNTGNTPALLSLSTAEWTPTQAQQHFTLTWNYTNTPLQPLTPLTLQLALTAKPTITGITDFSFTITITATEPPG